MLCMAAQDPQTSGSRHAARLGLLLLFCCASLSLATADDRVLHRFSSTQRQPRLEDLLYLLADGELSRLGLASSRETEAGAWIVDVAYEGQDDGIRLRYRVYTDTQGSAALVERSISLWIDQDFNDSLSVFLRQLFLDAGIHSPEPTTAAQALPQGPAQGPAQAESGTPPASLVESEAADLPSGHAWPDRAWFLWAGAEGMLLLGPYLDYFNYAAGGMLGLGWRHGRASEWSYALVVGFIQAETNGLIDGASLSLLPLSLRLRWLSGTPARARWGLSLAGGVTLAAVNLWSDALVKTMPYGRAALVLDLPLAGRWRSDMELGLGAAIDSQDSLLTLGLALSVRRDL